MRLTNTGVISDPEEVSRLCEEFRMVNHVRIPQLLEPTLLAFLERRLENCQWEPNPYGENENRLGLDDITEDHAALHLLHFVTNFPEFRSLVEKITDSRPLDAFRGRLYRKAFGTGHYNKWHNDLGDDRLVAMSINLSPRTYRGGLLEMRDSISRKVLVQVSNTGFGDALIFRLSKALEHQVSNVEGEDPKTAYAGWFRHDRPDFFAEVVRSAQMGSEPIQLPKQERL